MDEIAQNENPNAGRGSMVALEAAIVIVIIVLALVYFFVWRDGGETSGEDISENAALSEETEAPGDAGLGAELFSEAGASADPVPETNPIEQVNANPFSDYKNPFE